MVAESQGGRAERPLYTSPQRKLVVFFAQSRDQWKEKCRSAKARLKQLKKQVLGEVASGCVARRLEVVASAVEFILEGLHLSRRINKDRSGAGIVYRR